MNVRRFAVKTLLVYDMPASMAGFGYIVEAVDIISQLPDKNRAMITKEVYPRIAREDHTTVGAVEKAIRQAIKRTGINLTAKQFIMMILRVYEAGAEEPFKFV